MRLINHMMYYICKMFIGLKRNGQCVLTSSHCTKVRPKYTEYMRCYPLVLMSFGARICTVLIGQQSLMVMMVFPVFMAANNYESQTNDNNSSNITMRRTTQNDRNQFGENLFEVI